MDFLKSQRYFSNSHNGMIEERNIEVKYPPRIIFIQAFYNYSIIYNVSDKILSDVF